MRYTPFGETRFGDAPTDRRFTGQREEAGIGLYDYGARFYSAAVGRFISADSIVPGAGNSQMLNRYAYVLNNPLKFVDINGYAPQPPLIWDLWVGARETDAKVSSLSQDFSPLVEQLTEYAVKESATMYSIPDRASVSQYIQLVIEEAQRYGMNSNQVAYVLATAHHESHWGYFMEERKGPEAYYSPYYGRGFVQLTHESNYRKFTQLYELHSHLSEGFLSGSNRYPASQINLLDERDAAADPAIAAQILVHGMYNGSFTGVKISQYIHDNVADFIRARAVIGKGAEQQISDYAKNYARILNSPSHSTWRLTPL